MTDATATGELTADLRAELTVRGTTHPLALSATVDHDGDTVRISAQTTVDRSAFGVSGNMVGMMPGDDHVDRRPALRQGVTGAHIVAYRRQAHRNHALSQ